MNSSRMVATALRPSPAQLTGDIVPFPRPAAPLGATGRDSTVLNLAVSSAAASGPAVQIYPGGAVRRQTAAWRGIGGEVVRLIGHERFETVFQAPFHLLIAYERAVRHDGETIVEGLPRSTLRDFSQKLTFVPANCGFREWQHPSALTHATYLYIDPAGPLIDPDSRFNEMAFAPRLFFDNPVLWDTVVKLEALIEAGGCSNRLYAEALGVVLGHELARLNDGAGPAERPVRGGLAAWQRNTVASYIEEHLSEQISLAKLAELARLSPYHFSRAFKRSFGMPPHRYHASRRIERAKMLLAKLSQTVTEVGNELGFGETSAFSNAFHKITGQSPTDYRRRLR